MTVGGSGLVKQTHPIRGALWGLLLGLGLAIVLVVTTIIELNLAQMILAVVFGVIIGVVWGIFGPARRGETPAPPPLPSERLTDVEDDDNPEEPAEPDSSSS